ncbi:unnamed protein product [Citrullus colocynthis]|uniref:Uncharacterized protein n=1 Tax=Citrullus colocynthis TaxID=252529 RepID=A0ABP0YR30_9ROSI
MRILCITSTCIKLAGNRKYGLLSPPDISLLAAHGSVWVGMYLGKIIFFLLFYDKLCHKYCCSNLVLFLPCCFCYRLERSFGVPFLLALLWVLVTHCPHLAHLSPE